MPERYGDNMSEILYVNQTGYTVKSLLGHGKGGYSYLSEKGGIQYVLKQIHHEPCDYYNFGNKIEAEKTIVKDFVRWESVSPKCLILIWKRREF